MTKLGPQTGVGEPSDERSESSKSPERNESLWVLDRADNLLREVAAALWLSIASVWRIPRAAVARDSMNRLQALVANRQALPPRLGLLVASITSALFLAPLLPMRTPHITLSALLHELATASPENWLLVALPALISLWLTTIILGRLLRKLAGVGSNEPTGALMQVASVVVILSCLGSLAVLNTEALLSSLRRGLPDILIITGFWLMMAFPAVAGFRCAPQLMASSACPGWRRGFVFVVAPLVFVSTVLGSLVGTYWLLQAEALVRQAIDRPRPEPFSFLTADSPTCYAIAESVVCQVLLSADSDFAIGGIRQVDLEWRDLTRRGKFTMVSLRPEVSQVVQLAPRTEPGGFWILRAKEPFPFAFQIATADACQLLEQIGDFQRRTPQIPGASAKPLEFRFTLCWRPGFALVAREDAAKSFVITTEAFADPGFYNALTGLCNHRTDSN